MVRWGRGGWERAGQRDDRAGRWHGFKAVSGLLYLRALVLALALTHQGARLPQAAGGVQEGLHLQQQEEEGGRGAQGEEGERARG